MMAGTDSTVAPQSPDLPPSRLTREERETIIRTDDATDTWEIYTCMPTMIRKLSKIAKRLGVSPRKVDAWGYEFSFPRAAVSFRVPRTVSGPERERLAANLAAAREASKP